MPVQTGLTLPIDAFFGLDRSVAPHALKLGWLYTKSNFISDDKGALTKCLGIKPIVDITAPTVGAITSLGHYYYGGNVKIVAQAATSLYSVEDITGTATAAVIGYKLKGSGYTSGTGFNYYAFDDVLFASNASNGTKQWKGSNSWAAITMTSPSAPSASVGAVGATSAHYAYQATFVYLFGESNAGTANSAVFTGSAHQIVLHFETAPATALYRNIYRTRNMKIDGTSSQLYYLTQLPATTATYVDSQTDAFLIIDESHLCPTTQIAPPSSPSIGVFQKRMMWSNNSYKKRLYYSEFNMPYQVYPLNYFSVDDDIVSHGEWRGDYYIIQNGNIARITGTIGEDVQLQRNLSPQIGSPAPRSVAFSDKGIFFLANDYSVRWFDGYTPVKISDQIEAYLKSAASTTLRSAAACFVGDKYVLYVREAAGATGYEFDTLSRTWNTRTNLSPKMFAVSKNPADRRKAYFSEGSYVYQYDTGTAIIYNAASGSSIVTSTTAISSIAVTGEIDMGNPFVSKQITKVELIWTGGNGQDYMNIVADNGQRSKRIVFPAAASEADWGTTTTLSGDFVWAETPESDYGGVWQAGASDLRRDIVGIPSGITGCRFQLEIVSPSATTFSLKRIVLHYWQYEI